ncbi:MAG: metallophosphoesterase [Planctomycetota bacterium]
MTADKPSRVTGFSRRRVLKLGAAAGLACVPPAIYAFGIEPVWLRTVSVDVPVRDLPAAFAGYRIAQISDLHWGCGVSADQIEEAVSLALEGGPDLIALTGDFLHRGGDTGDAERVAGLLRRLSANDGVVAVLGNHDHDVYRSGGGAPAYDKSSRLRTALAARGIDVLEDRTRTVKRGDAAIQVAGFGDLWAGRFDSTAGAPAEGAVSIALSHNPDTAPDLWRAGHRLILSGHTHGGQVCVPFLGPPILPVALREFAAGLYERADRHLYVNRGVGWLARVRCFVRPEVTLLTLRTA